MSQSLAKLHVRALGLQALCLVVAAGAIALLVADWRAGTERQLAERTAHDLANRLSHAIADKQSRLEAFATRPDVIQLLLHGRTPELTRKAEEFALAWAGDANVTVALAMADSGVVPAVRIVTTETGGTRCELTQPVHDAQRRLLGFLRASFPADTVASWLRPPSASPGIVELQQDGQTVIRPVASGSEPATVLPVTVPVAYTTWTLRYRPGSGTAAILSGTRPYYLALALIAVIALFVSGADLFRRNRNAVRHDINSLRRMFSDVRSGSVRVAYPMALREFEGIFRRLRDSGRKLIAERRRLEDMGLIDHLSRLSNRRHFETRLKELFEQAPQFGPSSVLIIDVDHFKSVNDEHGHDVGDSLITGLAALLRKSVRQTDFLARLAGDEFCIIYPYVPLEKARALAERLRKQLPRELPLAKGVVHPLRWTGGLSMMREADSKYDDVLWRADQALIQAKSAGRNNTAVCDAPGAKPRPFLCA